jgi:uncharacterized repeat protein (TIGR01451 family)
MNMNKTFYAFLLFVAAACQVLAQPPAKYRLATTSPAGWQGTGEKKTATKIFEATHYHFAGIANNYQSGFAPDLVSWIDIARQYNPSIILRLYDSWPHLQWGGPRNMSGSYAYRYHDMWKFMENNPSLFPGTRPSWHKFEDYLTHWMGDTVIIPRASGGPRTVNGVSGLVFPQDARLFEFCRVLIRTSANSWNDLLASGQYIPSGFTLPAAGGELYLGSYTPEDMVRLTLTSDVSGGYSGVWEYCNAVDADGNPISWAALNILEDTTNGLTQSGYVRWSVPQDWKRCIIRNQLGAFYVRFRATASGTAPVVSAYNASTGTGGILRRAYVTEITLSDGNYAWRWPGWDDANDTNGDGYVDDTEYANRTNPNASARMKWQAQAVHGVWDTYSKGLSLRPLMGPGTLQGLITVPYREFLKWIVPQNVMMASPNGNTVDGVFLDNVTDDFGLTSPYLQQMVSLQGGGQIYSDGRIAEYNTDANNQKSLWVRDYRDTIVATRDLLQQYGKFVMVNSWHKSQEAFVEVADYVFIEFILGSGIDYVGWVIRQRQFQRWSRIVRRGVVQQFSYSLAQQLTNNTPANETLEMHHRDKMLALATFLCFMSRDKEDYLYPWYGSWYGSGDIASGYWATHTPEYWNYATPPTPNTVAVYIPAAEYDIGIPTGVVPSGYVPPSGDWYGETTTNGLYIYQQGIDPVLANRTDISESSKKYYIYARDFTSGAKVMVRPRSLYDGRDPSGQLTDRQYSLGDASAVDVPLGGSYRLLQADGTLSSQVYTSIRLRNAEAAILIPADSPPPQPSVQVVVGANKTNPKPLDVVTVTITARNMGNAEARNVRITHNIPQGATYVRGSLKLNGNALPNPTDTTKIDVTVPSIPVGGQAVVKLRLQFR